MKDLLGRDINQGDLVVVKPTGRNSSGLAMGVFYGKSVRFKTGKTASYNQFFKVTNPDEIELEIKNDILSQIQEEETKLKMKTIPFKELEIGRLYEAKNGNKEYYLGLGKFEKKRSTDGVEWVDVRWKKEKYEGYLTVHKNSYNKENGYNYDTLENVKARISKPQYIKALDEKIDIIDKDIHMESEYEGWYSHNYYKLNIELK